MSEWMAESIDWKQVRKDAGLPPGSEKALIEGYFYALKNPPEGSHLFTVDSLAAVLICTHSVGDECGWSDERCLCCERDAATIIQAAKEPAP